MGVSKKNDNVADVRGIQPRNIQKLALVNFGGIGDEILFTPVIAEIRKYLPKVHITLFLEDRSGSIKELLPGVDSVVEIQVQGRSKPALFFELLGLLRKKYFDVVVSSGSSPFIPLMLYASGIPVRVGFQTGKSSRRFLTHEAPLQKNKYAGEMYFSLARRLMIALLGNDYDPPENIMPVLNMPPPEELHTAEQLLGNSEGRRKILIHPGVSQVSIRKGIFKSWDAVSWSSLIQELAMTNAVYLVGGPDDAQMIEAIQSRLPENLAHFTNLFGKTKNLKALAALIASVDLLVSVDSAPLHLAVGYGTPVVAMFGPTDEKKLLPVAPDFHAVTKDSLACRPCLWDYRQESCEAPICLEVGVPEMLQAVRNVLG